MRALASSTSRTSSPTRLSKSRWIHVPVKPWDIAAVEPAARIRATMATGDGHELVSIDQLLADFVADIEKERRS